MKGYQLKNRLARLSGELHRNFNWDEIKAIGIYQKPNGDIFFAITVDPPTVAGSTLLFRLTWDGSIEAGFEVGEMVRTECGEEVFERSSFFETQ